MSADRCQGCERVTGAIGALLNELRDIKLRLAEALGRSKFRGCPLDRQPRSLGNINANCYRRCGCDSCRRGHHQHLH
ncbi:hypothetical protein [Bradyrhizobium sp. RT4b]|uniref:hypothetical protein n=1 Tax=Bradyrhizobium sp. RT4b TaxID=3156379 RepID=UPI0033947BA2